MKKYQDAIQIIKEFYDIRLKKYNDRKEFMKGMLEAEASRLENQARFILEKIEGKIVIGVYIFHSIYYSSVIVVIINYFYSCY